MQRIKLLYFLRQLRKTFRVCCEGAVISAFSTTLHMQQHLWQLGLTHSALYAQEHKAVFNA